MGVNTYVYTNVKRDREKKKRCSQAELPQTSSLASFMSFSQVSQQNWLQLKTPGLTFSQLQS